jgi:hypothetical protein
MRIFSNYNEDNVLSKMLMLYFAFQHGAVGFFFITFDMNNIYSEAFSGMSNILPMYIWGIIMLISCISFVMSVLQENKLEYWLMLLAGITGMVTFSMLAMANIEFSVNQTNTINYIIIASIDVIIAILGGVALWLRRIT